MKKIKLENVSVKIGIMSLFYWLCMQLHVKKKVFDENCNKTRNIYIIIEYADK